MLWEQDISLKYTALFIRHVDGRFTAQRFTYCQSADKFVAIGLGEAGKETCTRVVIEQVPTGEVSWVHAPAMTLTIQCQEMLAGFWKAAPILRFAVWVTDLGL